MRVYLRTFHVQQLLLQVLLHPIEVRLINVVHLAVLLAPCVFELRVNLFELLHLGSEIVYHGTLPRNHQTGLFELLLRGVDLLNVL